MEGLRRSVKMDNIEPTTPVGRIAVTLLGFVGAVSLPQVSQGLAIASALVSLVVGILTACVLVRQLRKK